MTDVCFSCGLLAAVSRPTDNIPAHGWPLAGRYASAGECLATAGVVVPKTAHPSTSTRIWIDDPARNRRWRCAAQQVQVRILYQVGTASDRYCKLLCEVHTGVCASHGVFSLSFGEVRCIAEFRVGAVGGFGAAVVGLQGPGFRGSRNGCASAGVGLLAGRSV